MRTFSFLLLVALFGGVGVSAQALSSSTTGSVNQSAASESPQPDNLGVGIRLVDVPAATQADPRAQSYVVDRLNPGAQIQRRIEVTNSSSTTQTIHVYAGAAEIDSGQFQALASPAANELTTWMTFDQPETELAAGESRMVLVTVLVPLDAPETEYYAAIWAEVRGEPVDGAAVVNAGRAGIRMYVSVGPGNGTPADFTVNSIGASRAEDGSPVVSVPVTNTGGRAVDVSGSLSLSEGPAGLTAGPIDVDGAVTIAPGETQDVTITLDAELPNGPWDATLALKSGLVEREAIATITFPDAGVGETVTPDAELPVMWIAIGSGAVLLVLAAGAVLLVRRRRIRLAGRATPAEPEPSVTE